MIAMQAETSLWFRSALLPQSWADRVRVTLQSGRILRIAQDSARESNDECHEIGLPGLANVHSHAFQRAMAGLTEFAGPGDDNFWTWRELMYRFLDRLGPEELEAVSVYAFMEMLETGFTHVGEFHYLHHDPLGHPYGDVAELSYRIVAAAQESGIGLTLLPVLYAHSNFGGLAPNSRQRRFINDLEQFARLMESSARATRQLIGAEIGVAPHSLRAVTPGELRAAVSLASNGPIHIHAAEQMKEVEDCIAWSGQRPVEWLLEHQTVDARWTLIHATHMTAEESQHLAASGAVAGLCPVTEANLGDGVFPAKHYLQHGGRFAVGTDSNILIGAAEELRALEYSQRLIHRRRNVLNGGSERSTGRHLFEAAVKGGHQATHSDGSPSGLAVGAAADIVSLDSKHPSLLTRKGDQLLDAWIFAAGSSAVDCVWRAGRKLVSAGRHVKRDEILGRYHSVLMKL